MDNPLKPLLRAIPRPWLIRLSLWARPILTWYYRGDRFTDPIDGRQFRQLLPYGYEKTRQNVLSPSTLSLERHRLLWLYLKKRTNFFSAMLKVLHIAPEQAFHQRFRRMKNIEYTTADLHSPLADVKADITRLPFDDHSFDVILCNHVLEHIPDDARAIAELFRVMKPGGWGIFQVPQEPNRPITYENPGITSPRERAAHFGQYDHVRIYGFDYFDRLAAAGFEVSPDLYTQSFTPEERRRYALPEREYIPLVRKPSSE